MFSAQSIARSLNSLADKARFNPRIGANRIKAKDKGFRFQQPLVGDDNATRTQWILDSPLIRRTIALAVSIRYRLKKGIHMKYSSLRLIMLTFTLCLCVPTAASALGLGFGAKGGVGSASADGTDQDLSAFMLVANFDLVALAVEGNLGWHRSAAKGQDDSYLDELSAIAIAKVGFPIVPALISLDFGAGLDQRFLLGATANGDEVSDASGSRTLLPLSVQLTGSVLLARLYGEVRYNRELSNSIKINGADAPAQHETLFLLGATF